MAKKIDFSMKGDYSFDSSLDIPDFDFNIELPKDTSKPITRVGKGVAKGLWATIRSSTFVRNTISSALPRGYGDALEFADQSARSLKELYDSTTRDLRPQLNELARITGRVIPKDATKDSDLMKKIRGFANSYDDPNKAAAPDPNESMITATLGGIFDAQQQMEDRRTKVADVKDRIREGIAQGRHKDMVAQLDAIRIAVSKQAAYQTQITANYQRKSLELQLRSYLLAVQAFAESKKSNAISQANLEALVRNTSLPDIVKVKAHEDTRRSMSRNRFVGGAMRSVFDRTRNFGDQISKQVLKQLQGQLKGGINGLRQGIQGADMLLDARDLARDLGDPMDPYKAVGEMGGSTLANFLGKQLGQRVAPHLNKVRRIRKGGNDLQFFMENMFPLANQWASKSSTRGGIGGALENWLKGNIRNVSGVETGITRDSLAGMQEPVSFDRAASKSITEIIPGYLARIYRELQIMRTGDAKTELTEFNYKSGSFTSQGQNRRDIFKSLIDEKSRKYTQDDINSLINRAGGKGLTPEQRKALGAQMLRDNVAGRGALPERLTDTASYTGTAAPHAKTFAKLFKKHFQGDDDNAKKYEFSSYFNGLGRYAADNRGMIQELVNNGQLPFMQELGIVDPTGTKIDLEKYYSYFNDEDYAGSAGAGAEGEVRRMRSRRSSARREPKKPIRWANASARQRHGADFAEMEVPVRGLGDHDDADAPLIAAIKAASSKEEAVKLVEILERIEARLEVGIPSFSIPADVAAKAHDGLRTVGGHAKHYSSKLWGMLRQGAGQAMDRARSMGNVFGGSLSSGLGWARQQGGKYMSTVADRWQGFRDVYIKGQAIPALQAWRLKAGEYIDQGTGQVIKSWKDIKGAVIDKDGNVILTAEQVKDAFTKSSVGEKLLSSLGVVIDTAKSAALSTIANVKNIYQLGFEIAKKKTMEYLDGPQDVYVKGRKDPALTAYLMKMGSVYFDRDTKAPIRKVSDIKGPVMDADGNILLTVADIQTGLVDKNGKPLRFGMDKLVGGLKEMAAAGIAMLVSGAQGAAKLLGGGWGSMKKFFSGIVGPEGIVFAGSKKIVSVLEEIRDLLDERLPGKKLRKGSLEDLRKERKEKENEENQAALGTQDPQRRGLLGGLLGKLGGLFGRKKKDDKEKKEDEHGGLVDAVENGVGQAVGEKVLGKAGKVLGKIPGLGRLFGGKAAGAAATAATEAAGGLAAGAAKKGLLARLMGSGLGKGLGVGAGLMAAGSLANATGHDTIGGLANAAGYGVTGYTALSSIAGLTGLGGGTALGALGAGAGLLGSGLAAGASALGALLSAPVTLPLLAGAGLAYGAYKGYQRLTRDNMGPLGRARYAQYGFLPTSADYAHVVFELENVIAPGVVYDGSGMPGISDKKVDWKKALEVCSIEQGNQEAIANFSRWFATRFKPVFLVAIAAIHKIQPKVSLTDADDKLTNSEKKRYFAIAKYPSGPYDQLTSPFSGLSSLPAGPNEVKTVLDDVQAEIDKLPDDNKKAAVTTQMKDLGAAGMALANKTDGVKSASDKTLPGGDGLNPAQASAITNLAGGNSTGVQSNRGLLYVAAGAAALNQGWNGRVDALSAIRFKTYGLKEMETDKVSCLSNLEKLVAPDVKFEQAGKASWSGSVEKTLASVGPAFGVEGLSNSNATNWITWFNLRFLPTYLNYRTALNAATGKKDADTAFTSLKPTDSVNVAMVTYTTTANYGGSVTSVWMIPVSPWPSYELNSEVATTDGNMKGLKDAAQSDKLAEQTAFERKTTAANNGAANASGASDPGAAGKQSLWDKIIGSSEKGTGVMGAVSSAWSATKNFFTGGGSSADMSGGTAAGGFGEGSGGAFQQLPMPQGNGYGAVKGLIEAASKMAGVDPNLMKTMAAIESGFNATVKAGTSSATGLYQFIKSTWDTMIKKYGAKYGIAPGTPPTDPRANALLGAEFLKENAAALKGVKPQLTDTDLYLAHFLGAGGAKKLLSANPSAIAAQIMPEAANANRPIFYDKSDRPRTVAEVYQEVNRRVREAGAKFGLGSGDGSEAMKTAGGTSNSAPGSQASTPSATAAPNAGGASPNANVNTASAVPSAAAGGSVTGAKPPVEAAQAAPKISVPVADTTPGLGGNNNGLGFSNRAMSLSAQAATQQEASNAGLIGLQDVFGKQLDTQTESLAVLKRIADLIEKNGLVGKSDASSSDTATAAIQSRQSKALPDAPVSVRRKSYQ